MRLWQRLFLAFATLSSLALLGFVTWQQQNFRRGFLSYLDEVAQQRLEPSRARLLSAYVEHGGWDFLRNDPAQLGELIEPGPWGPRRQRNDAPSPPGTSPREPGGSPNAAEATDGRERPPGVGDDRPLPPPDVEPPEPPGAAGWLPPPPDQATGEPPEVRGDLDGPPRSGSPGAVQAGVGRAGPPPDDRERAPVFREPDPRRRPPGMHGPPDLMPRLLLLDAAGIAVAGNRNMPTDALSLPLLIDEKPVGTLRLARQTQINAAVDLAFSRTQLRDALLVGVAILVAALLLAFALARWLLAPVRALTVATRALAAGDFGQRVATARHDELGALAQDFNRLAATLEQNRQARQRWGADIAHELRTPLSVLRGEIQALQDGVRAPTAGALDSLQAECLRLGSLVDDLYQLSLADAGALDYRFEPLDLAEFVRDALALQQRACRDAGLSLEADLAATPPVRADARRLGQLIDNLLGNARRYTDAPGRIRIAVGASADHAALIVDDTPPGVPAAALPRLFDRLYRVETARARNAGGAGLGLSICRAIVDAHGGTIVAEHSPLGGLRIVVQLPLAEGGRR